MNNERKKIDTIVFISTGYRGGANKYLENNINYLRKKNLFLVDDNPIKNYKGIKNKKIDLYKIKPLKEASKLKLFFEKKIVNQKIEKKTLIFFTNYALVITNFLLFLKLKKKGIRICIALHSGIFDITIKNSLAILIFSILAIFVIDKITFGSNSAKKWWLTKFPWLYFKNNKVIHNGVQINKIHKKKINTNKIKISFIGRLEKENNPLLFCEIAKTMFQSQKKKLIFNIFGDGSLKNKVKRYSSFIHLFGWCDEKYIYKNSDIVLITSPFNNFPYVAIEAKSYGIPVVTCSRGDISKIIKHKYDGIITSLVQKESIIQSLNEVINKYEFYSNNAINNSRKFDLNTSCKKIWNFNLNGSNYIR